MFYLVMQTLDARTRFIEHLKARGILAVFHYVPLHLSRMGQHLGDARECTRVRERMRPVGPPAVLQRSLA